MSSSNDSTPSSLFRIELLREDNWVPWKRRVTAILRERGLLRYAEGTEAKPIAADPKAPTAEETAKLRKWEEMDGKAQTQIELTLSDTQMIHIAGAITAAEMWKQLKLVKEARGKLGILSYRRRLYRTVADESTDIVEHITEMRRTQEELGMLGSQVSDEDFLMLLITSLPESWDQFTTAYLGATGNNPTVTSHEFIAIVMEENRRRLEKSSGGESAMYGHGKSQRGRVNWKQNKEKDNSEEECWNCHKRGHISAECWSKGGGMEGKGPKSRGKGRRKGKDHANQAKQSDIGSDIPETAYPVIDTSCPQFDSHFSCHDWLADSGTTSHICNNRDSFMDFKPLTESSINGIGNQTIKALGRGTVIIDCKVGSKTVTHHLKDTLFAPKAINNLISISRLDDAGMEARFRRGKVEFLRNGSQVLAVGHKSRRLYQMAVHARITAEQSNIAEDSQDTWDSWHRRFGHLGITGLQHLAKDGLVEGLTIDKDSPPFTQCEACIQAKQTHNPYPQEAKHRREIPGELTHSDVWGPARVASLQGSKYNIAFTDDATRRCVPKFMKVKSQAFDKIKEYITFIEQQFGVKPKVIRVDNAKELISKEVKNWLKEKGIELQTTAPYAHSSNGVAERFNRTLIELTRAMLIARGLPSFLWETAIEYAAYIRNMAPTRALEGKTPEEAWTKTKPNVSHLKEFGCDVWILTEGQNLSKLEPKSKKFIFVGYLDGPKAVKYYDPRLRQIRVSRNFIFAEPSKAVDIEKTDNMRLEGETGNSDPQLPAGDEKSADKDRPETGKPSPAVPTVPTPSRIPKTISSSSQSPKTDGQSWEMMGYPRRSDRAIKDHNYRKMGNPDSRLPSVPRQASTSSVTDMEQPNEEDFANLASIRSYLAGDRMPVSPNDFPRSLKEAEASAEWPEWKRAMDEEIHTIQEMGTYTLEDLPKEREAIGSKWVFSKKYDENGNVSRYKARLVAQGYSQIPGVDFYETFAPVVRLESVRAALGIAAIKNLEISQMDVKGAYLNGELKEEIFMRQPQGYDDGSGRVCRLHKTLYGLKQSGREWNREFNRNMMDIGFSRLEVDHCVYKRVRDGRITVITVWVDDLLIFTETVGDMAEVKGELQKLFDVKDLGEPKKIIGIEIERDRENGTVALSQTRYIDGLLSRFNMQNAHPVTTPLDPNVILRRRSDKLPVDPAIVSGYQAVIGSLLYAAQGTRPDLAHPVQELGQYASNPGPEHWTALKRVLRYLAGTRNLKLVFRRNEETEAISVGYSDASYASNRDDLKSVSGYAYLIGGASFAWSSKKQSTVALSSTEAEYTALAHATRQAIWNRNLLAELGCLQEDPTLIFEDNQSAIAIARDPQYHARSKHFDVQNHFVREKIEDDIIELFYCPTDEMVADVMTKALPRQKHDKFVQELGLLPS